MDTLGVRHLQRLASGRRLGGRPLGPVRPATARLLERIPVSDQGARLRLVERSQLAGALSAYYGAAGMLYAPSIEGRTVLTSVLCRTDWLDVAPLDPDTDLLRLVDAELGSVGRIGQIGAR